MKSMRGIVRKITASLLAVGIMGATLDLSSVVYAEKDNVSNEDLAQFEEESFINDIYIAMDEEGNVELIPMEEMEPIDLAPLEGLEEVEFQVVVEEAGATEVIETVETLEEAEEIAEEVEQEIAEEEEVNSEEQEANEESATDEPTANSGETQEETTEDGEGLISVVFDLFTLEAQATGDASVSVMSVPTNQAEIVVFKNLDSDNDGYNDTTNYTNAYTGTAGYLNSLSAPDAAYLGEENGKVKFRQAGVTGWVDSSLVEVYTYNDYVNKGKVVNKYTVSNGKIYHNITTNGTSYAASLLVGFQQPYMSDGATYYSYDGNYFYTDFAVMVADYKAGHYSNAINASIPYYNYYQYLPHRTTTNFTAEQINQYLASKIDSSSKMYNTGQAFIDNQNQFGVNAVLMVGVAINESAWGTSSIAKSKNNLFGHGAVDSNPYGAAGVYSSPANSISYHADIFVSQGYADPKDWRYYGSHLGNKESGMNVKYASDPYWGEKAAAHGFLMEDYFSDKTYDVNKYTIGITSSVVKAYTETDKANSPYNTSDTNDDIINNLPVVVLENINANGQAWYKVRSDAVLSSDRKTVNRSSGLYDFSRDYVYMEASRIRIASEEIELDAVEGRGDTSGDGLVKSNDYLMIKDYIMGDFRLNDNQIKAADVSGDGLVKSNDYLMIKDYIMGKIQL